MGTWYSLHGDFPSQPSSSSSALALLQVPGSQCLQTVCLQTVCHDTSNVLTFPASSNNFSLCLLEAPAAFIKSLKGPSGFFPSSHPTVSALCFRSRYHRFPVTNHPEPSPQTIIALSDSVIPFGFDVFLVPASWLL